MPGKTRMNTGLQELWDERERERVREREPKRRGKDIVKAVSHFITLDPTPAAVRCVVTQRSFLV